MREKIKIIMVVAFFMLMMAKGEYYVVNAAEETDGYKVIWEDNFDGTDLDRNIWNVEVNGNGGGNQEHQYYVDSRENIEVSNGTLKIRALNKSYMGKGYTSGRINTRGKAEFKYGKVEARIKLPSFQGAWPAFWMLGGNYNSVGWPRCGEIDIMEAINRENFTHGALHWFAGGQKDSGGNTQDIVASDFNRTQWHTYAIEWNKERIKWLVDDVVFYTQDITDGYMGEFRKEQFIILNLAIGGQWPGHTIDNSAMPATMEVDYVKISRKLSDNGSSSGTGIQDEPINSKPDRIEYKNALQNKGSWQFYFNRLLVNGSGESKNSAGYVVNIDKIGINPSAINASIIGLDYMSGETYKFSFKIKSNIQKNVLVKVVGEDPEEDVFCNQYIYLQKDVTYNFLKDVTIDKKYDGRVDMIIEMGGRIGGEYHSSDTQATITVSEVSFMGNVDAFSEVSTEKSTEQPTDASPVIENPTIGNPKPDTENRKPTVSKPEKTKILNAKRKKKKKIITIKLKKVRNVDGYQIRYSTTSKFKKYKNQYSKKIIFTIKRLKVKKKYYVKARAYRINNCGKKIYGRFCKKKKI